MSFIIYLHVLVSKMKEIVSYHLSASQNQTYILLKLFNSKKAGVLRRLSIFCSLMMIFFKSSGYYVVFFFLNAIVYPPSCQK